MYPHVDQGTQPKPDDRPTLALPPPNAATIPSLNFTPSFASPSWGPGPSSLVFASLSGSGAGAFTAPGGEMALGGALRKSSSNPSASTAMHVPATWASALTRAGSSTMDVLSGSPRESLPYAAATHSDRFSHIHYNHIGGNERPDGSNAGSSAQGQLVSTSQLFAHSPTADPRTWQERPASNHSRSQDLSQQPLLSKQLLSRTLLPAGVSRFDSDHSDAALPQAAVFVKPAPLSAGQNYPPSGVAPPTIAAGASAEGDAALRGGQCGELETGDGGGSGGPHNTPTRGAPKKRKPVAHAGSRSVVAADGYFWHKYGQKSVMDKAITRAYFRCARHSMGCTARKTVDLPIATPPPATAGANTANASGAAPSSALAQAQAQVSYHGEHNHGQPGPCTISLPNCAAAAFAAAAAAAEADTEVAASASPGAERGGGAAGARLGRRTDHERRAAMADSADVAAASGTGAADAADAASAVAPLALTHRLSLNSTVSLDQVPLSAASAAAPGPDLMLALSTAGTTLAPPAATLANPQRPSTADAAAAAAEAAGDSGSCTDEPMVEQSKHSPAATRGSMEVGSARVDGHLPCAVKRSRSHSVEAEPVGGGDEAERGGSGAEPGREERRTASALLPQAAAAAGNHPSISAAFAAAAASAAASAPAFALPSTGPVNLWAMMPPPATNPAVPILPSSSSSNFHGLAPLLPMHMHTPPSGATHLAPMAHAWNQHSLPSHPHSAAASPSPLAHHLPAGLVCAPSMHPPAPLPNPLHHSHALAAGGNPFAHPMAQPLVGHMPAQAQAQLQAQLQAQGLLQAQVHTLAVHKPPSQQPGISAPSPISLPPYTQSAILPPLSVSGSYAHQPPAAPATRAGQQGGGDADESARHVTSSGRNWNSIMEGSSQGAKRICVEWSQIRTEALNGSAKGPARAADADATNFAALEGASHVGAASKGKDISVAHETKTVKLDLELKL
ncbi:hypothetical protein CLOM_g14650 [Closterium sp. NIES-68]|nr:hypothetical protein CLOM_g14650 [Closterium sp. NIES-68]GJP69660.1 hypothetical protein CLOP_g647 [Closterium sp. NIES-67]